jgi:hypothetical protein
MTMPVKALLIVGFLVSALTSAQEVRRIDLTGARENRDLQPVRSGKYLICGTDEAKGPGKAVRVSVESLTPTDIHPAEQIFAVLRVENYGQLSVVLPVSPNITDLQTDAGSIRYAAMLPLMAGVPNSMGVIMMGWLELYGSTLKSNTTLSLKPGEWIIVRGDVRVRRWYEAESRARAYSELQLYEWLSGTTDQAEERCVKQVLGGSIPVRFGSLKQSP